MDNSRASELPHGHCSRKQHRGPCHLGFIQSSVAFCIITACARAAPAPKGVPGAHEVAAQLVHDLKSKPLGASSGVPAMLASITKVYTGKMMRREKMTSKPAGVASKPTEIQSRKEVAVQPLGTLLQTQGGLLKQINRPAAQASETTRGQHESELSHRVSRHEVGDKPTAKEKSIARNVVMADRPSSTKNNGVRSVRRADAVILEDVPRANVNQNGGKVQPAALPTKNVVSSRMPDHRAAQGPLSPAEEPAQPAAQGQLSPAAAAPKAVPAAVTAAPASPPTTTTTSLAVAVAVVPAPVVVRSQEGAKPTLIVAFLCGCAVTCGCTCLLWWLTTRFMGNHSNILETRMTEPDQPGTPSTFYRRRTTNLLGNPENTDADDTTNGARCSGGSETESKKNGAKKPG